jgi:nucleotide-binding universal stress UspA family protein
MKILIAVDEGAHTAKMLDWLGRHADWFGPQHAYTVLHVVPAVPSGAAHLLSRDDLHAYYAEQAEKSFAAVRAFFESRGLRAQYVHEAGTASEHIASHADKARFDLLVLGSHGHGTLGKLFLGSTATKAIGLCHVPVLVVRE